MATNKIRFAGEYTINRLELFAANGRSVELHNIFQEINLYESLFSNFLTGNVVILDGNNLIKYLPIVGQEKLVFSFNTPGFAPKKLVLDVFKITNKQNTKDDTMTYMLHFVTPEFTKNAHRRISQAFSGLHSDMAARIMSDTVNGLGPLDGRLFVHIVDGPNVIGLGPDKSKFRDSVVIPNWNPATAMNFLASRAVWEDGNAANFVFYETTEGFHFESIEKLVSMKPIETLKYEPKQYDPNKIELNNVNAFELKSYFDTLGNAGMGFYSNKIFVYDPIKKTLNTTDFDYKQYYMSTRHLEDTVIRNVPTMQFTDIQNSDRYNLRSLPNQKVFFASNQAGGFATVDNNNVTAWLRQRMVAMTELHNYNMAITIPGNSNYRAGHVIVFNIPDVEPVDKGKKGKDPYFSGRFIITSLRHIFKREQHDMVMDIAKDSLASPLSPVITSPFDTGTVKL